MSDLLLRTTLDRLAAQNRTVKLWLRDDDAVEPTPALEKLLALTATHSIPVTLAVIPEHTGPALAERLETAPHALVAVHGWSHVNHAPASEKKQELGLHRPASVVLRELQDGLDKLQALHEGRFIPMLVPPWNRIARELIPQLPDLGFSALSVFNREKPGSPIALINTHVDIMDWHGTYGGRPADALFAELVAEIERDDPAPIIGVLTHHLVHDAAAWDFLTALFAITANHPACEWVRPDPGNPLPLVGRVGEGSLSL